MKALFLRWLYGLKRPLFIVLFGSMALLMFVVVIMMFIMGTDAGGPKAFDASAWLSSAYIAIIFSVVPLIPIISDYDAPFFGKYLAILPVSRSRHMSAMFIYSGMAAFICSVICAVIPVSYMMIRNDFEWRYLLLGMTLTFCATVLTVFLLLMIEIAFSNKNVKTVLSFAIMAGIMFLMTFGNPEEGYRRFITDLLIDGNYYFMSLAMLVITAAIVPVLWAISCLLYKRRQF